MSDPAPTLGIVSLDVMCNIVDGMSATDVFQALGEPFQRLAPEKVRTPSETFAEAGSSFRFNSDQHLTEVWVYRHDCRGKCKLKNVLTSYLGFEGGKLRSERSTLNIRRFRNQLSVLRKLDVER